MQIKLDLDVNKKKTQPQANEVKYPKKYLRGTRVSGGNEFYLQNLLFWQE